MKHKWIKKAAALFAAAALVFSQAAVCMAVDLTPNPPATIQDAWYTGSGDLQTQFSIHYGSFVKHISIIYKTTIENLLNKIISIMEM